MNLFSAPPLRASVGAESSPYTVKDLINGDNAEIAIFSLKSNGFPVWAYARQKHLGKDSIMPPETSIWLYLAQEGIPIYSVPQGRWTNVSRYVAQSATAADASLIQTVDVSKGGVLQSGNSLYASDALGISEVKMEFIPILDFGQAPLVSIKAMKGLARIDFTPAEIYRSLSGSSLGLSFQDSKDLPKPPPIPEPPTSLPKPAAAKPFPTGKWVAGGAVLGGLLWALGRRP